jgi:signal transduction histidine kinase
VGLARVGAAALGALTAAGLGAGWALHVANDGSPSTVGVTDWWLFPFVSGVSFAGTGAWLVWVRPRLSIGWLALAIGTANSVMLASLEYGVWTLDRPHQGPLGVLALWLGNWLWVSGLLTIGTVLPLLLPDGRLPSRRWRAALALSVTAVAANSLDWALIPYAAWSPALRAAGAVNPFGVEWTWDGMLQIPLTVVTVGAAGGALGSLVVRWRRSAGVTRQQFKWILFGAALTALLWASGFAFGPTYTALAMVPLPAACLVAVLRFRLWDIDLVVSRSLLYAGLTAGTIAVYIACVGLLGILLGRATGAPLVATAVAAVCVEPLHRRLRTLVNRLVYGKPDDPFAVIAHAGLRLAAARDAASVADEVLPEVVASVATALRLPYVAVSLVDGTVIEHGTVERDPAGRTAVKHGAGGGEPLARTPLAYGGQHVGELVFSPRPGGMGRADRRLLDDLARHAAVAAHTVVLTRDLARSREQLVTAREEERRRLYRELHDGLGPALAALALQVETARDLVPANPAAALVLLDRATPRLISTVDEVRTIVRGLRPPALDDLGLASALRELGGAFAAQGFAVSVEVTDLAALPAAVEVAAYRIAAEALTNAVRHSGAASVTVRLERQNGQLRLTVQDDGCGCPAVPSGTGFGITSMRDRARELGGTFTLAAGSGGYGTRVEAVLPSGLS